MLRSNITAILDNLTFTVGNPVVNIWHNSKQIVNFCSNLDFWECNQKDFENLFLIINSFCQVTWNIQIEKNFEY